MQSHQKQIEWIGTIIGFLIVLAILPTTAEAGNLSTAPATLSLSPEEKRTVPLETEFTLSVGYREDELDWSIAGNSDGENPNILSELTWENVESYQVKLQGSMVWPNRIAVKGYVDYGWISDGNNQDSDYLGDDRTLEFSRSNNDTDDDDLWDASIAIGYPFRFGQTVLGTLTPLLGYSYHEQNLNITDGFQTIPNLGPFPGLDSSYETEWYGPWIGFDLRFKARNIMAFAHRFETYFTYEYHWFDYKAEADWNLREDFAHPKSFEHDTDGNGWRIGTGFNVWLHRSWALNFNFDYQDWSTDNGRHKVFFFPTGALQKQNLMKSTGPPMRSAWGALCDSDIIFGRVEVNGCRIEYANSATTIQLRTENHSIEFRDKIRENSSGRAKEGSIPLPWCFQPNPEGFLSAEN